MNLTITLANYNNSRFLKRMLDSIYESYEISNKLISFEIIVIDDCSSIEDKENLKKIIKDYKNTEIYFKEKNMSVGHSRELSIKIANGKYLLMLDIDDWLDKSFFSEIEKIKDWKDIVFFEFENSLTKKPYYKLPTDFKFYKKAYSASTIINKIVRVSYLRNNNFKAFYINQADDIAFMPPVTLSTKNIVFIEKVLLHYYINPNSISNNSGYMQSVKIMNEKFSKYEAKFVAYQFVNYPIQEIFDFWLKTKELQYIRFEDIWNEIMLLNPSLEIIKIIEKNLDYKTPYKRREWLYRFIYGAKFIKYKTKIKNKLKNNK